jgi:hypothetical protein
VRTLLSDKHGQLSELVASLLEAKTEEFALSITKEFEVIMAELSKAPTDIEALVQVQNYIDGTPQLVRALEGSIKVSMGHFGTLQALQRKLPAPKFNLQWTVAGWPRAVADKIREVSLTCGNAQTAC